MPREEPVAVVEKSGVFHRWTPGRPDCACGLPVHELAATRLGWPPCGELTCTACQAVDSPDRRRRWWRPTQQNS